MENLTKKRLTSLIIQIFFMLVLITSNSYDFSSSEEKFGMLVILSFCDLVIFSVFNCAGLLSASWFTVIFLYVYNFGQAWLLFWNIPLKKGNFTIAQYSNANINDAMYYALAIITCLQLAITLFYKDNIKKQIKEKVVGLPKSKLLLQVTKIVAGVCFLIDMINNIEQIIAAQTHGYIDSYVIGRDNVLIQTATYLFPFLITLLILQMKKREQVIVFTYAMIRSLVMMLLVGNRGQYIAMIIILLLLYMKDIRESKGESIWQYVMLVIVGLFLLSIASYVADTRGTIGETTTFTEHIKNNNVILAMLNELGGTLINTILIMGQCPQNISFGRGISYLGSVFHLIPGFANLFPNIVQYNDLGSILNNYFIKGEGLGGSYIAEMYFNFSWLALGFQLLFGYLLVQCDNILRRGNDNCLKRAIVYHYIFAIFMYTRGNFRNLQYIHEY